MANLKASIKSIRRTKTKTLFNQRIKRRLSQQVKTLKKAINAGDTESAQKTFTRVTKMLDKAESKNVISNASRKKSRLQLSINKLTAKNEQTAE